MKSFGIIAMLCVLTLSGCAGTRSVTFDRAPSVAKVGSAALVPSEGNSSQMDGYLAKGLAAHDIKLGEPLPAGTNTTATADLIVSYVDAWHWDLVMYLRYINIYFHDGKTGDLVLSGRWQNSAMHGYPNAENVVKELLDDMIAKLPNHAKTASIAK